MSPAELSRIDQTTYRTVSDHGLWDLVLGIYFLALGLALPWGQGRLAGLTVGLLAPALFLARKSLIEPRLGFVQLNRQRQSQLRRGSITAAIVALGCIGGPVALELVLGFELGDINGMTPLLVGGVLGLPIAVAGLLLEVHRLVAYAVVVWLLLGGVYFGIGSYPSAISIAGAIVSANGAYLLTTFLRRYPAEPGQPGHHA